MANCITRHIPNTLTCCNLLSGCMAVIAAFDGNAWHTLLWVIAGAAFDFLDGCSARLLKAYSPLGKELDSLADLITFGLSPSVLCWRMLQSYDYSCSCLAQSFPYIAFILVAFAALRLAKFNLDERQTTSFRGLAVPANALFWCGLLQLDFSGTFWAPYIIGSLAVAFAFLMTSDIPMFSLKFKNLSWKQNRVRFIFLGGAAVIIALAGFLCDGSVPARKGLWLAMLWYMLLSVLTKGQF